MQHPIRATRSTPAMTALDSRRLARKITAGASLLLSGAMMLGTSLPAAAVEVPSTPKPAAAALEPVAQALEPISSEAGSLLSRDDIVVHEPAPVPQPAPEAGPVAPDDGAGLSPARLAELQAVADSEPAGSSYGGDPAFPRVWSMLETDYVQTPFPDLAQMPISSGFGYRDGGFHGGTDVPLPAGQDIRPIAVGVVSEVFHGDNPGGGGYSVFIDHNIGGQFVQSWYGHMMPGSIQVEVGQVVDVTTVIGDLGNSGRSTGPHLHLELKNSDYVSFDPVLWLKSRQMDLETSY
jgi:murein DD-endopeptidase MepM/ murein hydrolase activator NlpD